MTSSVAWVSTPVVPKRQQCHLSITSRQSFLFIRHHLYRHARHNPCKNNDLIRAVSANPNKPTLSSTEISGDNDLNDNHEQQQQQQPPSRSILDGSATPLLDALNKERDRIRANFFCPGHKQGNVIHDGMRSMLGNSALRADLPELPALDNLFAPEGVLLDAQQLVADAFTRAGRAQWTSFLMVNGTTGGMEASLLAFAKPGTCVLLPRNAHQSAVHALVLCGAKPVWIDPVYDSQHDIAHGISPCAVDKALRSVQKLGEIVSVVLVVSPTYHGVISDITGIANVIQQINEQNDDIVLVVDEAHGAHLAFFSQHKHNDTLPISATECGAHVVLHSVHKTLPALTQAAVMHVRRDFVDVARIRSALQLVQSSSPSYLLLSSLDTARAFMVTQGKDLLTHCVTLALDCAKRVSELPGFSVLGYENSNDNNDDAKSNDENKKLFGFDPTRITVLLPPNLCGFDVDEALIEQFGVYVELPAFRHVTLVFTIGSTQKDVDCFVDGLTTIANEAPLIDSKASMPLAKEFHCELIDSQSPVAVMTPREAFFAQAMHVPAFEAVGRIAADTLCPYPPGIPVLLPGEIITEEAVKLLKAVLKAGGSVSGASDETLSTIRVVEKKP